HRFGTARGSDSPRGKGGKGVEPPRPAEKWQERATLREPKALLIGVTFSPDGKTAATGTWNGTVLLGDLARHEVRRRLQTGHRGHVSVAFSPDGKAIASTGSDGMVKLWNPTTGKEQKSWRLPPGEKLVVQGAVSGGFRQVAFSPDGKSLAAAGG